jgi:hypothetical protein
VTNEFTRLKKQTRRNSTLQSMMSCARLRTNRKIELHENLRFDNEINELHNHVRHHCRQRLRNRANERQNDFLVRKNQEKRIRRAINQFRTKR